MSRWNPALRPTCKLYCPICDEKTERRASDRRCLACMERRAAGPKLPRRRGSR